MTKAMPAFRLCKVDTRSFYMIAIVTNSIKVGEGAQVGSSVALNRSDCVLAAPVGSHNRFPTEWKTASRIAHFKTKR